MMDKPLSAEPFYNKGLNWDCIRCSYCCRVESGYVFLSEEDAERLAGFFNMELVQFEGAFCRWLRLSSDVELLSLKEKQNNDCFFWKDEDGGGCSVYHARPSQCRTYPFWKGFLEDGETWKSAAASCPGAGQGRLYTLEEINAFIKIEENNPPRTRQRL